MRPQTGQHATSGRLSCLELHDEDRLPTFKFLVDSPYNHSLFTASPSQRIGLVALSRTLSYSNSYVQHILMSLSGHHISPHQYFPLTHFEYPEAQRHSHSLHDVITEFTFRR